MLQTGSQGVQFWGALRETMRVLWYLVLFLNGVSRFCAVVSMCIAEVSRITKPGEE